MWWCEEISYVFLHSHLERKSKARSFLTRFFYSFRTSIKISFTCFLEVLNLLCYKKITTEIVLSPFKNFFMYETDTFHSWVIFNTKTIFLFCFYIVRYYELDPHKSLLDNLRNKVIIEYPTFHVVLKESNSDMQVLYQGKYKFVPAMLRITVVKLKQLELSVLLYICIFSLNWRT